MADNTTINPGAGGDQIRDKDRSGVKTQIVGLDLAPGGTENLMNGVMPVSQANPADQASGLSSGRKTVTAAGTAVALAATSSCKWVTVTGILTNTQVVFVGGSDVVAAAGSAKGVSLQPGGSVTIPVNDPSKVFVDARVAGEGVTFMVGS